MKKITAIILTVLIFCAVLCGCGNDRNGAAMPDTSPLINPSMSPRVEDGVVTDRDGILEDEEDRIDAGNDSGIVGGDTAGEVTGGTVSGNTGKDTGTEDGTAEAGGKTSTASPSPSASTAR